MKGKPIGKRKKKKKRNWKPAGSLTDFEYGAGLLKKPALKKEEFQERMSVCSKESDLKKLKYRKNSKKSANSVSEFVFGKTNQSKL